MGLEQLLPFTGTPGQSIGACQPFLDHVRSGDIEPIRLWRNAQLPILRQNSPLSEQQQRRYWFEQAWPAMQQPYPTNILLSYRWQGQLIGYGGLVHIDWGKRCAELSSLLPAQTPPELFEPLSSYYIRLNLLLAGRLGLQSITTQTFDIRPDMLRLLQALEFCCRGYIADQKELPGCKVGAWLHERSLEAEYLHSISQQLQSTDLSALRAHLEWFRS